LLVTAIVTIFALVKD